MVVIDNRAVRAIYKVLAESNDMKSNAKAVEEISKLPNEDVSVSLLTMGVRDCGLREGALMLFEELCRSIKNYTPEEKAGQLQDFYFYGTKVPELAYQAMRYTLNPIESGQLDKHDDRTKHILDFIVRKKKGEVVDRARKLLEE